MSESHANVVSFDDNVSTLSNLYERNELLLMNETTVENMTTIGTVYKSMMRNQRTYLANQAPVVQRLDNVIQRINRYPVDKC